MEINERTAREPGVTVWHKITRQRTWACDEAVETFCHLVGCEGKTSCRTVQGAEAGQPRAVGPFALPFSFLRVRPPLN